MDSGFPDSLCPDFQNPGRRVHWIARKPIKIKASIQASSWHRPCKIEPAAATVRQLQQGDNDVRFPFPVFLNSSLVAA